MKLTYQSILFFTWHDLQSIAPTAVKKHNKVERQNGNTNFKYYFLIVLLVFLLPFPKANCQDKPKGKKEFVRRSFGATQLINLNTTTTLPKRSFTLNIQHRFGETHLKKDFIKDFAGMDLSSNIRFAFQIPVTKRIYLGIGRTKYKKNYDASMSYTPIKQTTDGSNPISLSILGSVSYMSDDFQFAQANWQFKNGDNFYFKDAHRFSYYTQVTVSRSFAEQISLLIAPMYSYNNLATGELPNSQLLLGIGGKIKTSYSTGIILEYTVIANKVAYQTNPLSFGFEIATASHAFQVVVSSSRQLLAQEIYKTPNSNIADGNFHLGFNIFRTFYRKR